MNTKLAHEGHELEITTQPIDVTSITERDPNWTHTDSHGHVHRYDDSAPDGPYPTLEYRPWHGCYEEGVCDYEDDQDLCYPVLGCTRCGEHVVPGLRAGTPRSVPGMTTYLIDGEPVSKQAAEDFMAAFRAEQAARLPGMLCKRCEQPLSRSTGHVCRDLVANPVISLLVREIRSRGLLYELTVLVGLDEAKRLIRNAWFSLDTPQED